MFGKKEEGAEPPPLKKMLHMENGVAHLFLQRGTHTVAEATFTVEGPEIKAALDAAMAARKHRNRTWALREHSRELREKGGTSSAAKSLARAVDGAGEMHARYAEAYLECAEEVVALLGGVWTDFSRAAWREGPEGPY